MRYHLRPDLHRGKSLGHGFDVSCAAQVDDMQPQGAQNSMEPFVVLISGIPASGKSSYGRWLAREKGFMHLDVEQPGVLRQTGLEAQWNDMFAAASVELFVKALRLAGPPVVLDWGFPPRCLSIVEALKNAGVDIWWFDGDRRAARESFLSRGSVSVHALDVQMAATEKAWPGIQAVFGSRLIETVSAGPVYLEPGIIFERMFGSTASE